MTPLDLLHTTPKLRFDAQALRQTLTFAFATGGGGDAFDRAVAKVTSAPSQYSPECYANDLFLEDFVARCLVTRLAGAQRGFHRSHIKSLLSHPPSDRGDVELRQGVFRELGTKPSMLAACEETWRKIDALRTVLEAADVGKRSGAIARRVEILRHLRDTVCWLPYAFGESDSALLRLSSYAEQVQRTDGFKHLVQLLDYEDNLATLDLTVRVGRDGEIRALDIVRMRENSNNPVYRGPWRRFWERVLVLFRGYSLHEREVIGRLVETVFDGIQPALVGLIQAQLQLEFYLSVEGLRRSVGERGLEVSLPEFVDDGAASTRLERLFNPFLLLEDTPPVPCDLDLPSTGLTILTGPNSGGKTRLMQAIGVTQLLAQSGCYVPAKRARLGWRSGMFVSLVHESSADQREGRLGTELIRIRRLFERIGFGNMVLLDELCSGTNPSEGEEIVELVIALLHRLRPQALICTHFLQFAARLEREPPIGDLAFLQVELDAHQKPLYRFVPGVATTSLAAQTAERLGVTREALEALIEKKSASSVSSGGD
jgi:DNA mismatch repair protein MutS2